MSGKRVPLTGNITLRTAPASAGNAIFEVFGTPGGNNLVGLVGIDVDTGTRPPPFAVASSVPTAASGNLKMSFFAGKSVFLTPPTTVSISAMANNSFTPNISGGGGTSFYVALGTGSAGTSNTTSGYVETNNSALTAYTVTPGTPYYVSAYASNATNLTASLAVSNTSYFGVPTAPSSPLITLTSLQNWSLSWTASTGTVVPTYYWALCNTTTPALVTSGNTSSTSVSGTTTLSQANNYAVYVYAGRTEANSASVNSGNAVLNPPEAPTAATLTSLVAGGVGTASYTPNITGGSGLYVILATSPSTAPATSWSSGALASPIAVTTGSIYYINALSSNATTLTVSGIRSGTVFMPASPNVTVSSVTGGQFNTVAISTSGTQPSATGLTYDIRVGTSANEFDLFRNASYAPGNPSAFSSNLLLSQLSANLALTGYITVIANAGSYASTSSSATTTLIGYPLNISILYRAYVNGDAQYAPNPRGNFIYINNNDLSGIFGASVNVYSNTVIALSNFQGGRNTTIIVNAEYDTNGAITYSSNITPTSTSTHYYGIGAGSSITVFYQPTSFLYYAMSFTATALSPAAAPPTGGTLTIISTTNYYGTWTAPTTGVMPTSYQWTIRRAFFPPTTAATGTVSYSSTSTGTQTNALVSGVSYVLQVAGYCLGLTAGSNTTGSVICP